MPNVKDYALKRGYDPYLKGELSPRNCHVPANAIHIFSTDEFCEIEYFEKSFYFYNTSEYIEFWTDNYYQRGIIARLDPPKNDLKDFVKNFLLEYFVATRHFFSPGDITEAGYLKKGEVREIIKKFKERTKRKKLSDLKDPNGILKIAENLGLYPRHDGGETANCIANCPGTHHFLMISPSSGEWGCGWCKRKGGPDDLKRFVKERKERGC